MAKSQKMNNKKRGAYRAQNLEAFQIDQHDKILRSFFGSTQGYLKVGQCDCCTNVKALMLEKVILFRFR